jgi:hypothetical protein
LIQIKQEGASEMNFLRNLLGKVGMRKQWWLVCVGVALVLCGLLRNANQALIYGLYGTALMLFGVIGDTIAPTANKVAYFNKVTGQRVNADGTPFYTGTRNFIISSLITLALGFIGGMCIYGVVAITLWIFPNFNFALFIVIVFGGILVLSIISSMFS